MEKTDSLKMKDSVMFMTGALICMMQSIFRAVYILSEYLNVSSVDIFSITGQIFTASPMEFYIIIFDIVATILYILMAFTSLKKNKIVMLIAFIISLLTQCIMIKFMIDMNQSIMLIDILLLIPYFTSVICMIFILLNSRFITNIMAISSAFFISLLIVFSVERLTYIQADIKAFLKFAEFNLVFGEIYYCIGYALIGLSYRTRKKITFDATKKSYIADSQDIEENTDRNINIKQDVNFSKDMLTFKDKIEESESVFDTLSDLNK